MHAHGRTMELYELKEDTKYENRVRLGEKMSECVAVTYIPVAHSRRWHHVANQILSLVLNSQNSFSRSALRPLITASTQLYETRDRELRRLATHFDSYFASFKRYTGTGPLQSSHWFHHLAFQTLNLSQATK